MNDIEVVLVYSSVDEEESSVIAVCELGTSQPGEIKLILGDDGVIRIEEGK